MQDRSIPVTSVTVYTGALRGQLELVLDIGDLDSLKAVATLFRRFPLPDSVRLLARNLGMRAPPGLVRTAAGLQKQLLHPHWRILPV